MFTKSSDTKTHKASRLRTGTREKEIRTISTSEGGGAQVKIRHDDLMGDARVQTYRL